MLSNQICALKTKKSDKLRTKVFKETDEVGLIQEIEVENISVETYIIQPNQVIAVIIKPEDELDMIVNKDICSYFLCSSIDLQNYVKHLSKNQQIEWIRLLRKWSTTLSKNKYNVELTKKCYRIRLMDEEPVKLYVPRRTPAMVEAINKEIGKFEKRALLSRLSVHIQRQQCVLRRKMEA